jgi:hypothetical protein
MIKELGIMRLFLAGTIVLIGGGICSPEVGIAQDFQGGASQQESARAVGHYARARSLLVAAIAEFDAGVRIAEPSTLIDPRGWREALADRVREIERVLDPQPRSGAEGLKFSPDRRLLAEQEGKRQQGP